MLQLKALELPDVVQSPMAACTDLAFRTIARSCGMQFAFLEMISAHTLMNDYADTYRRMETNEQDKPVGVQLVGCDPEVMGRAAARVEEMGFPLVDMNLGCPVAKVVSHGGGSELLREPEKARKIFRSVVRSVKKIPVTVKMRLGYEDASGAEGVRIAEIAQDEGVDGLAVHGRTRKQGYSGAADYEGIRRIKEAVKIPVFGNGDVVDGASAVRMRSISGCDGVMLGRGALGNPWIYGEVQAALAGKPLPERPSLEKRKAVLMQHIELMARYHHRPTGPLRRIIVWYFKDIPRAAQMRNAINQSQTVDAMETIVEETFALAQAAAA